MKFISSSALLSFAISSTCFAGNYYAVECSSEKQKVKVEFLGRENDIGDRVTIHGKEEPVQDIGSDNKNERYESGSKNFKVIFDTKTGLGTMKLNQELSLVECKEI